MIINTSVVQRYSVHSKLGLLSCKMFKHNNLKFTHFAGMGKKKLKKEEEESDDQEQEPAKIPK